MELQLNDQQVNTLQVFLSTEVNKTTSFTYKRILEQILEKLNEQ